MSLEDNDSLKNASAIIERFGGIRPMAAKVGAPVTTVQGWKKRDVIPGARREDVINAANDNGIDLSDLLSGEVSTTGASAAIVEDAVEAVPESAFVDLSSIKEKSADANSDEPKITIEPIIKPQPKPLPQSLQGRIDTTHEDLMAAIAIGQKRAVNASLWTTAAFVITFAAGAAFLLWPSAKKVERHDAQLATLESKMSSIDDDVQGMNETANFLKGMVPENVQRRMTDLKEQADQIQESVTSVAMQAENIRDAVLATDAGSLADRLAILEAKFNEVQGGEQLGELTARIRGLESTFAGQGQLETAMTELRNIVDSLDGQVNSLETKLVSAQQTPNSNLGQTLEGVSGNDLKAAAMLIAFSQFRDSLNRNAPLQDDVVLLQKLAGSENPELQDALARLAPQAEKGGVLTSAGLSNEFKTLAGDIVFSSLKGEDVSVTEKAKVRLTEIINVKKDGEVIGGNQTQQTVARAQAQLDSGDVQGAIATLQSLDGNAKAAATPFIEQAQATVLAEQVETLLRQTILASVGSDVGTASGSVVTPSAPLSLDNVKDAVKGALPGQQNVVKDEESGFSVLPAPKGFKGFSDGNAE